MVGYFWTRFFISIINDQIIDLKDLTDDIKMNGIENKSDKFYVPYDKGDKEGNKWYLKTRIISNGTKTLFYITKLMN